MKRVNLKLDDKKHESLKRAAAPGTIQAFLEALITASLKKQAVKR